MAPSCKNIAREGHTMDYSRFDAAIRDETKIGVGFMEILSKGSIFVCTNMVEFDRIISLEKIKGRIGLYMH